MCLLVLAIILPGCGGSGAGSGKDDSGIRGVVLSGPACPVEQANSLCPDMPFQGSVKVVSSTGTPVLTVRSGRDGRFEVVVRPGVYLITPEGPVGGFGAPLRVAVRAHAFTEVKLRVDSGIR